MNSGGQVFQRLAEFETQSRKAAKIRPHAQVSSFDMWRADVFDPRVAAVNVPFFGVDESPEFIGLHIVRANVAHALVEMGPAFLADSKQQVENCFLMHVREARHGAHTHSFKQERHDPRGFFRGDVVPSKRLFGAAQRM